MRLVRAVALALEDIYGSNQEDEASALIDKLADHGLRVTRDPTLFDDLPRPVVDVHLPEDAA